MTDFALSDDELAALEATIEHLCRFRRGLGLLDQLRAGDVENVLLAIVFETHQGEIPVPAEASSDVVAVARRLAELGRNPVWPLTPLRPPAHDAENVRSEYD